MKMTFRPLVDFGKSGSLRCRLPKRNLGRMARPDASKAFTVMETSERRYEYFLEMTSTQSFNTSEKINRYLPYPLNSSLCSEFSFPDEITTERYLISLANQVLMRMTTKSINRARIL